MTNYERIENIERQLVRLRWYNLCLIICIALSLGLWFVSKNLSGVKEIRASRFIVEDENGKSHGGLWVSKGVASLVLLAENGRPRAALSVLKGGSVLVLNDENEKCRAELKVDKVGPIMSLFDENVKPIWSAP